MIKTIIGCALFIGGILLLNSGIAAKSNEIMIISSIIGLTGLCVMFEEFYRKRNKDGE
ncbi:MAG: hypothetical protein ACYCYI_09150 [Saccharofermentanales bacterium]